MKKLSFDIKLLSDDSIIPYKTHETDFAYDVVAVSEEEIAPNVWKYGLGIQLQLDRKNSNLLNEDPTIFGISIRPRSSIWKTGMILSNSIGTIDEGYTGEISMVFYHIMTDMPRYKVGDRIGQIYFDFTMSIKFNKQEILNNTERGNNGYGSTGK